MLLGQIPVYLSLESFEENCQIYVPEKIFISYVIGVEAMIDALWAT